MPYLHITCSDGKHMTCELDGKERVTIGRSSRNDVVLADLALSRNHAEVEAREGGWILKDAGSRNGTFLNGQTVESPTPLRPGDRIGVGGCTIQFQTEPDSTGKVLFSDEPMAAEGTVFLAVNDVMTMPDADMAPSTASRPSSSEKAMEVRLKKFQIIEKANLELLAHEPMDVLLPKVLDLVARAVNPDRVALFLEEDGALVCRSYRGNGSVEEMSISRTIAETVMKQQVAVLTSDALSDARFKEGASIMAQGIRSVMAVPLWNNKAVIGLIYADSRLASGLFEDDDLRVITSLANVAAIQIENALLFEQRLASQQLEQQARAAAEIQRRLLPAAAPEIQGYALEGLNTPCYEVGGDYYDFFPMGSKLHGMVLADVSGKGMGAAMLMASLQATCRARAEASSDCGDVVRTLNNEVSRLAPSNRFVTLFFIELDPGTHRLRFVNAGHAPPPVVIRNSGERDILEAGGLPLGILPDQNYTVGETALGPGEFVFLCSDGVTETVNGNGDEYGDEQLEKLLLSLRGRSPEEIRQAVEESLENHAQGAPQPDDLTMVIVQRRA